MVKIIRLILCLYLGAVSLSAVSCSKKVNFRDNYEGFMGHTLRVYSAVELPERGKDYTEKEVETLLKGKARKRAAILVTGYFQVHYDHLFGNREVAREINAAFKNDRIVKRSCSDEKCHAFVDYNLKKVFKIINRDTVKKGDASEKKSPEKSGENEKEKSTTP